MNYVGLFEGISGFGLAFKRAGANVLAVCEIDKTCQSVLRRHHPEAEIISDVKTITKESFGNNAIDVIAGGFPCQDLSVAGLRKGLDGERSGLWFEFLRIITDHKPRIVIIENVPGLLSSNGGRDFAVILRGLVECGYGVCWRVFDSQYDGVAQRRARVFIVASFGNASCTEILFERDGSAWDSPPSREAGQGVTGTLKACASSGGWSNSADHAAAGLMIPDRIYQDSEFGIAEYDSAGTIRAGRIPEHQMVIQSFGLTGNIHYSERPATLRAQNGDCGGGSEHLIAFGGNNQSGSIDVATACNAHGGTGRMDFESETFIVPIHDKATRHQGGGETRNGDGCSNGLGIGKSHDPMFTLDTASRHSICGQFGVRRLTPVECEALQGFPRNWTAFGDDGKPISDSARYRMLGNAVCVPTAEWIARRIL